MVVQAQGERWKAGAVKAGGEEGVGRMGEDGGEGGGLLLVERGRRGAVSCASGARVQVRQRRRWRPLSTETGGGLSVQFCGKRAVSLGRGVRRGGKGGVGKVRLLTRHTTVPQRWHSPTMSRAHLPIFPLVIRPIEELDPLLAHAWYDTRTHSASLAPGVASSLTQRRLWLTSCLRYWSRLARNCLQVLERSCREFRSSRLAS